MSFSTLSIKIVNGLIKVRYGIGLVRKKIHVDQIESLKEIEYMRGHGFGPRLTPEGWFFNVANSGAIKLNLRNGKTFFIGTNEPSSLAKAISSST